MNSEQIVTNTKSKLEAALTFFEEEQKKLRTGRAHPSMLEGVTAEAYGQQMPLIQLATISTPEPQLLQLTPFDPNNLESITSAIRDDQSLGMNPMDDGRVVRVPVPPLTEERRVQIVKQLNEKAEECLITMRGARHDALKSLDQLKKDKEISEDEQKRLTKNVEDLMNEYKAKVEASSKDKEAEILKV